MASVHCCSGLRRCRVFKLVPLDGIMESWLYYLESCPVCEHTVAVVASVDFENNFTQFRKTNAKARKLFEKLKPSIMFEEKHVSNVNLPVSKFYLRYNEYGSIKKCFSNLSSLQLGKFDPYEGFDVVENNAKLKQYLNIGVRRAHYSL